MRWKKVWSREYSVQYCEMALHSVGKRVKLLTCPMSHQLILPANHNQCCYFEDDEEQKFMESIVTQFSGNPQAFRSFVQELYATGEEYVQYAQGIYQQDVKKAPLKKLAAWYEEYQERALIFCCMLWLGYLLNEYWTIYGNKLLSNVDAPVRAAVFKPQQKSTVFIMQEEARRITQINGANEKKVAINQFWKTYQWLPCLDLHNPPWTIEHVEKYIREIKPSKNTVAELSFEEAVQRANLSHENIAIFRMITELAYLKDKRDDFRRQGIFYIQPLFRATGKKLGLSLQETAFLTEEEILAACTAPVPTTLHDKTLIAKRQQGFLMYLHNDTTVCVTENISEALAQLGFTEDIVEQTVIKGLQANKGHAQGKVVIVRKVKDLAHVTLGCVLVAVTTHPDYVPAMQKAVAIITDEGGLLSHAAIVSRELGIPCIVGTGNATNVLNNGDTVMVDADAGTVQLASSSTMAPSKNGKNTS